MGKAEGEDPSGSRNRYERRRNLGLSLSKHASLPRSHGNSSNKHARENKSAKHPAGAALNYSGSCPLPPAQEAEMETSLMSARYLRPASLVHYPATASPRLQRRAKCKPRRYRIRWKSCVTDCAGLIPVSYGISRLPPVQAAARRGSSSRL